ncbi:hypothetical protein DPMN_016089 [Dreissena polymorpha]|uniref:Uncharacterized protein n=1 Tax=Dreissena polymorpha TaxID=45954 RepID=A0A9D4NE39_DREPO|nr:hypothetical protein DPMN_016089 [Dreissena polymorpha]
MLARRLSVRIRTVYDTDDSPWQQKGEDKRCVLHFHVSETLYERQVHHERHNHHHHVKHLYTEELFIYPIYMC